MVSVRPHLWFDTQALEAAQFYAEHIPGSSVDAVQEAPEGVPDARPGAPFVVELTVCGIPAIFLNAGPSLKLDEAFSFYLRVDGQEEVDHYWDLLTADGGKPGQCGWCTDRFGVSWQVVPVQLEEALGDYTSEGSMRALQAMLSMGKIDVAALEAAYAGPA